MSVFMFFADGNFEDKAAFVSTGCWKETCFMQWCRFLLLTDHRREKDTFAVLHQMTALPHYNHNKLMVEGFI